MLFVSFELTITTMINFRFKKIDFDVICKEEKGGALVTVLRDKFPTPHNFYLVKGKLYMLSKGKWVMLDSGAIATSKRSTDPYDISVEALIKGMMKVPIGMSAIQLDSMEQLLIEAVVYDVITQRKIEWLKTADTYYLGNAKMVAVTGISKIEYTLPATDVRKNLQVMELPPVPITQPKTGPPVTPKLVISPTRSPSVMIQTTTVQKKKPKLYQLPINFRL